MRLDLEEYDFTVEYLRGMDNYVADALSRITIEELKHMNEQTNYVLKVTTRSMNNVTQIENKNAKAIQDIMKRYHDDPLSLILLQNNWKNKTLLLLEKYDKIHN